MQREEGHKNVLLALGDGMATYAIFSFWLFLTIIGIPGIQVPVSCSRRSKQ